MRPVEGTILTVLREAAEAAAETATPAGEDLGAFLGAVLDRATESLERTPELLPVLKHAGVVDAGGAGFLLLLAALVEEVSGEEVVLPAAIFGAVANVEMLDAPAVSALRYEVMYFLDADDAGVAAFRESWAELGDSIVVVGGGGTWNCHIHTDDVGGAIEAGIDAGRPHDIRVTDLLEQAAAESFHGVAGFESLPEFAGSAIGTVAVAVGDGLAELFRSFGAQGLVVGGQTMNPSLADMLEVIAAVPAETVIVLPNNKNIIPVAERADAASPKSVVVVPTRSIAQGLAAIVANAPDATDAGELAAAMAEAALAVRSGEVTQAVRDAETPIGRVNEGDWLGIADGQVALASRHPAGALTGLLADVVAADAEIVTLLTGDGSDEGTVAAALAWLAEHRPDAECEVVSGGQPLYPYLVSVE
jgi:DAK2 domain fusion protein YloV